MRSGARPQIDIPKRQRIQRTSLALVVVREEFRFVGGDIDAGRAIAFATLAGEAEVERLFDRFILPAIFYDFALRHLPEQMSASAGGVFFFAGDAKARTHHAAFIATALSHTD